MNDPLDEMEKIFLAFGDKTRLRILDLIGDGAVSVNFLCESLGESQPKVSRHLAYLRSMNVVQTRREGKWIYYSILEPESISGRRLFRDTLSWLRAGDREVSGLQAAEVFPVVSEQITGGDNVSAHAYTYHRAEEMEVYLL